MWHAPTVGLVGPDDVKTLQTKVHDYRASLQASVDAAAGTPAALPLTGVWSIASWGDVVGRCTQFENESTSGPLAYLYAGSAYDRGRELITELDKWRDQLATHNAPNVPAAVPVPSSDLGLAGGIGMVLVAVVVFMAWREFGR